MRRYILFGSLICAALIGFSPTIESAEAQQSGGGTVTCPSGDQYNCFSLPGLVVKKGRGVVTERPGLEVNN